MTPTRDTSKEAVERMAVWVGSLASPAGLSYEVAAMLRALLARAEAAEAELAVEQEARELASESDAGWEQVANAARAEAARLRSGIEKALLEVEDAGPKALKYTEQELRAALATEARDE